jgi:bacillithiol synthase
MSTGLEVLSAPISGPPLITDYVAGNAALAPFFYGDPFNASTYQRKADAVARRMDPAARARAAASIRATTPSAAARLERVLAGNGFLVTTGQQAGLFGGPLYTLHKILTAAALAERLEALLGVPVLPLFWSASEDHDWAEVNHAWLLDTAHERLRLALSAAADAPQVAMARRTLGPDIVPLLDALPALLPATDAATLWLGRLRHAYQPERTMAAAFEAWIAALFADRDLLITSAADPALKEASRPVLHFEAERAREHALLVETQTARLVKRGYHAQVPPSRDVSNLQYEDEQGRERLIRDSRGWLLRRTKRRLDAGAITGLLEAEPWRISPNVLLRPVVESALFPTLAYVGGAAELSYFAQIGCLFHGHGIEAPVAFPRQSVQLIEPRVRKSMGKLGLEMESLHAPFDVLAGNIARAGLPPEVTRALADLRERAGGDWSQLAEAAQRVDPTLLGPMRAGRLAALQAIAEAEQRILRHARLRSDVSIAQLRRVADSLRPGGGPQERGLNLLPFLARYGDGLFDAILASFEIPLDRSSTEWEPMKCPH